MKILAYILGTAAGAYALSIAIPIICFVAKGCNLWGSTW